MNALALDQLEDLARGAIDAHDRAAFVAISFATTPILLGWKPRDVELDALALAVDAWVGRCLRTGGKPWMRSYDDPTGTRPCPGCAACSTAEGA